MADPRLLSPPDSDHFETAIAALSSANPVRAHFQLDKISAAFQLHPDVLELRWNAHVMANEWDAALNVGSKLVQIAPEDPASWLARCHALHRLGRTQEAWDSLLPAADRFSQHALVSYNLACYASVLGNQGEAWQTLQRALMSGEGEQIKHNALEEPELETLWPQIREWSRYWRLTTSPDFVRLTHLIAAGSMNN